MARVRSAVSGGSAPVDRDEREALGGAVAVCEVAARGDGPNEEIHAHQEQVGASKIGCNAVAILVLPALPTPFSRMIVPGFLCIVRSLPDCAFLASRA